MTAAELVGRFKVDTPEWHAARRAGLGGSEIAAVLGWSKWQSRFSLWHHKNGLIPPQEMKVEMEWGRRLENAVCQKFADDHPEWDVVDPEGTYRSSERPWQIANPDRLLLPADKKGWVPGTVLSILEAKTADRSESFEWGRSGAGAEGVPPYYLCQVRWYMDVFGVDRAYVAVLIGGNDYREFEVDADPAYCAEMREAAQEFLADLAAGVRPDLDAHGMTYDAVRRVHDGFTDDYVELPPELAIAACEAVHNSAAAASHELEMRSRVLDFIGDGKRATFQDKPIAYRQRSVNGVGFLKWAAKLPTFDDHDTEESAAA